MGAECVLCVCDRLHLGCSSIIQLNYPQVFLFLIGQVERKMVMPLLFLVLLLFLFTHLFLLLFLFLYLSAFFHIPLCFPVSAVCFLVPLYPYCFLSWSSSFVSCYCLFSCSCRPTRSSTRSCSPLSFPVPVIFLSPHLFRLLPCSCFSLLLLFPFLSRCPWISRF